MTLSANLFKTHLLVALAILMTLSLFASAALSQEESTEEEGEVVEASEEQRQWKTVNMPFNYENIQVPRKLWEVIKDQLKNDGVSEEKIQNFGVLPISIQAEISADQDFVLRKGINYKVFYKEGGGELDLFDFVSGKGRFNIRFAPHLVDDNKFHMLYLSDSPGKNVGRQPWGNGCGKIYDLTSSAHKFLTNKGMRVTSARRHYLHLMAGTYVFTQLVEDRLYLGYIRLTDSRYPQFNCRESQD